MSQKDIVQELVGALNNMREAMRDIADAAGDVPEWNKGGAYYEACRDADRAVKAAEARLAEPRVASAARLADTVRACIGDAEAAKSGDYAYLYEFLHVRGVPDALAAFDAGKHELRTYQYNDPKGDFDPSEDTGETRWVAAGAESEADAYATACGWERSGREIFDVATTRSMLQEPGKAGIDVVLDPTRPPRIGVRIEGGVIHAMFADAPVQVTVIDYDDDGGDQDAYVHVPQGDGSTARAYASVWTPEISADAAEALEVAIERAWPARAAEPRMRELCERAGIRLVQSTDAGTAGRWGWINDDSGEASGVHHRDAFDAASEALNGLFREDWNGAVASQETERSFLDYVEHEGLPHYLDETPGVSP